MKTVCALDFDEMTLTTRYQSSIKRFPFFFFFPSFFFSSRNSKPCTFRITILKWCSRVWNSIYWHILVNLVRLGKASTAVKKISE